MKKLKRKYKNYLLKKHFKALSRRNCRIRTYSMRRHNTVSISGTVCAVSNLDYLLDILSKCTRQVRSSSCLYLNLEDVVVISASGLVVLLASIYQLYQKYPTSKIRGNLPNDSVCRERVRQSGFLNYVSSRIKSKQSPHILKVHRGSIVEETIAKEICDFYKEKLEIGSADKTVYPVLIECMANTHNHAYEGLSQKGFWWTMAIYEDVSGSVQFAFYDTGQGITETIPKKFKDRCLGKSHHQLLQGVLMGEYSSSTKKPERGKGIPYIFRLEQSSKIKNLSVISGRGNVKSGTSVSMKHKLEGSLLAWDFVKE